MFDFTVQYNVYVSFNLFSWNFGYMSRDEAVKILEKEHEDGVFCVRESTTQAGSLVLCVK